VQDHIYDDMVIDSAEVRVILPEGASNIQVKTPFATERLADGVCCLTMSPLPSFDSLNCSALL
jgi:hypothetical protein